MKVTMSKLVNVDTQEVIARAAEALSQAWGQTITFDLVQPISGDPRRNFIARAVAVGHSREGRPVIIKTTRSRHYDPEAEDALQSSGLVREWVATALVSARAPNRGHGSALLAGDVATGTLVFEDLGADLGSLVEPLLEGTAEAAEHALKLYATALGRLHADTVGCLEAHYETYRAIFGARRRPPPSRRIEEEAAFVASKIGPAPPASELAALSSRLNDPGPWLSLVHGDPCPDNSLLYGDQIRLIDYEFAHPSHALLDGIYWRMGFPTCWCAGRVPADVAARIDLAYRAELANCIPLALDDAVYYAELAWASAIWLFACLSWRLNEALDGDDEWGTWSIRGRLLWYLQAVIEMTEAATVLPGLRAVAKLWLLDLQRRWPNARTLGLYPAFRLNRQK